MQTWFMAVTLKTWHVNTICPPGWSEEEGGGTDVAAESGLAGLIVAVAMGVKALNTGAVGVTSPPIGDAYPDGVEACSVANSSESGAGVGENRLQPRIKNNAMAGHRSLFFFIFQFN